MDDDPQNLGDLERAAAGPAARAALAWVQAALNGHFAASWAGLDPAFRTVLAQEWIGSNQGVLSLDPGAERDAVVAALAAAEPEHRIWREHGQRVLRRNVERLVEPLRGMQYGTGTKPRLIPPDLEAVILLDLADLPVDKHGIAYLPSGEGRPSYALLMRAGHDGHLVRGVGTGVYDPGWPPTWTEVLRPED